MDRAAIRHIGRDLQRPECVLAERDGIVWAADARGGVMRIAPDGNQRLIAPAQAPLAHADFEARYVQSQGSLPNGMTFLENGDFLVANWGSDSVEVMTRGGRVRRLFDRIDGQPQGKANFPLRDSRGRLYLTVTTRMQPWTDSINDRSCDGYIALFDKNGNARIVADGFEGTNEIRLDAQEEWMYVVESNARRISRLRVLPDGGLGEREVYGPARLEGFPDGFAFDSFGNLWVTLVMTDKLIAITPEGEVLTLLDDSNVAATLALDAHYEARTLTPEIMAAARVGFRTGGSPHLHRPECAGEPGHRLPTAAARCAALDTRKAFQAIPEPGRDATPTGRPNERRRATDAHRCPHIDGKSGSGFAGRTF